MPKKLLSILAGMGVMVTPQKAPQQTDQFTTSQKQNISSVKQIVSNDSVNSSKVLDLKAKDIEKLDKATKRINFCLMGIAYDLSTQNPNMSQEQMTSQAAELLQNKVNSFSLERSGLYGFTQDPQSEKLHLKKVDWNNALKEYTQKKIPEWNKLAAQKNLKLPEYLLNNISGEMVCGYMYGTIALDEALTCFLSDSCKKAASDHYKNQMKQVQPYEGNVVTLELMKKHLQDR